MEVCGDGVTEGWRDSLLEDLTARLVSVERPAQRAIFGYGEAFELSAEDFHLFALVR